MLPKALADRLPNDLQPSDVEGWVSLREGLDNRVGETVVVQPRAGGWLVFTRSSTFDDLHLVELHRSRPMELDVDEWHRNLVLRTADGEAHRIDLSATELDEVRQLLSPPEVECADDHEHEDALISRDDVSWGTDSLSAEAPDDSAPVFSLLDDIPAPTAAAEAPAPKPMATPSPTAAREAPVPTGPSPALRSRTTKTQQEEEPAGWGTVGITLLALGVALYIYMQWFQ